jgi:hypothetical protein
LPSEFRKVCQLREGFKYPVVLFGIITIAGSWLGCMQELMIGIANSSMPCDQWYLLVEKGAHLQRPQENLSAGDLSPAVHYRQLHTAANLPSNRQWAPTGSNRRPTD